MADITITKATYTISFSGTDGSGTATKSGTKTGVTATATPLSGLSNGDKVTLTATPKTATDTLNGGAAGASVVYTYDVTGLTAATPPAGGTGGSGVTAAEFKDGSKLRDGSAASAEFKALVTAENADAKVTTTALSAAFFDENSLDPYEVANAK